MDGLFGSPLVQTAVAMAGIWFLAAMACAGIVQLIAMVFGFKATNLWAALGSLLTPGAGPSKPKAAGTQALALARAIPEPKAHTSYARFVDDLDGVSPCALQRVGTLDRGAAIEALSQAATATDEAGKVTLDGEFVRTPLGKLVTGLPPAVKDDAAALRAWFGTWFDQQMASLTRLYRSRIRWWTAAVGLVMAIALQVDSVAIAQDLYAQPTTRRLIVAQVEQIDADGEASLVGCDDEDFGQRLECVRGEVSEFESLEVIGWQDDEDLAGWGVLWRIVGVAATTGAIAAGAPFWYDVLRRLMGLKAKDAAASTPSGAA